MSVHARNSNQAKSSAFDLIPAGLYIAKIIKSKVCSSKIRLTFEIIVGPYAGRRLQKSLNPAATSFLAEMFFQAEIAELCRAVGVDIPKDYRDPAVYAAMHHTPLVIDVRCDERSTAGTIHNRIEGYMKKR